MVGCVDEWVDERFNVVTHVCLTSDRKAVVVCWLAA